MEIKRTKEEEYIVFRSEEDSWVQLSTSLSKEILAERFIEGCGMEEEYMLCKVIGYKHGNS